MTLINATLSGNYGGGIYHHFDEFLPDHVVTVRNSIVASNTGLNCFVDGGPTVVGNNLTTDGGLANLTLTIDVIPKALAG